MSWTTGLSWTKGYWQRVVPPPQNLLIPELEVVDRDVYVSSGPFFWKDWKYTKSTGKLFDWYFYFGFRPTPPWPEGYGDEGILGFIGRWMKRHGYGNFGAALRIRWK